MEEDINIKWSCHNFSPSLPPLHLWIAEVYMQCINTLPSLSQEETSLPHWPTEIQQEDFRAVSAEHQFGWNHKLVVIWLTPLPWAGHDGKTWEQYEDSPFLLQAKLRAGQASPLCGEQGLKCLLGVWVLSTAQVTAQAQGTKSYHSFFRVADHDLLVSGVLQDPLPPFSPEHGINLAAALMSC